MKVELTLEDFRRLEKLAKASQKTLESVASSLLHEGCLTSLAVDKVLIFADGVKQPIYSAMTGKESTHAPNI